MRNAMSLFPKVLQKFVVAIMLATGILTGCGDNQTPTVIAPNVTVLTDETAKATVVEDDSVSLPLAGNESYLARVPGDILVSGYGNGFLRRVLTVAQVEDRVVITTEQAALEDAVISGSYTAVTNLGDSNPQGPAGSQSYALSGDSLASGLDLTKTKLTDKVGGGLEVEISQGHARFNVHKLERNLVLDRGLKEFELVAGTDLDVSMAVQITAKAGSESTLEKTLWTSKPWIFTQFIGIVPVVEVITIDLKAGFELAIDGEVAVEIGATAVGSAELGVKFKDGQWSVINEHPIELTPIGPNYSALVGVKLKAYLRPELNVKFYAVAGPALYVDPYAAFELNIIPPPPAWVLKGGVEGGVDVDIDILGHVFAKFDAKIFDFNKVLAKGTVGGKDGGVDAGAKDASRPSDLTVPTDGGLPGEEDGGADDAAASRDIAASDGASPDGDNAVDSGQPVAVATHQGTPVVVTIDPNNVYWANNEGTIMRASLAGGEPVVVAAGQLSPYSIAVDRENVYWANQYDMPTHTNGCVMKVPLVGGNPVRLASGRNPVGMALDANNVYWTDNYDGTLNRTPLGGGETVVLAANQDNPLGVAVDAVNVYWSCRQNFVMKMALVGGEPAILGSGVGAPINALAIDAKNVYFADGNGGNVLKVPITGGAPTILASGQNYPFAITVDEGNVYWTNFTWGGSVMKVPLAGGRHVTLATGLQAGYPRDIAVNATHVFWTDSLNDSVWKILK